MNLRQTLRAATDLVLAPLTIARPAVATGPGATFDHSLFDTLLRQHSADGRIDYAGFDRAMLDQYLTKIALAQPETLAATEQLAFWINAYNALVIRSVLQHFPLASVNVVPDFFTRPHAVGGQLRNLGQIEHGIVRRFGDSRVHAALVCAADSCPVLSGVFIGDTLLDQLDGAMQAFLADPSRGMRYDSATQTLHLSPIFRWFASDFGGPVAYVDPRRLVPALSPYIQGEPLDAAVAGRIVWMDYDWSLNSMQRTEVVKA